ncbi:hypothetical protein ACC736_38755, partial [Rhizobium ruizarguesonis]
LVADDADRRDVDRLGDFGKIVIADRGAGDQDGSTPPDLILSTAKLISGDRYEVIPDCAHIPCVEKPEALTAIIRAFLTYIPSG